MKTCAKCSKEHPEAELVDGVCADCRKASDAAAELARKKHEKEAEAAAAGVPGEVVRLVADVERGIRADLQKLRGERASNSNPPASTQAKGGGGGGVLVAVLVLVLVGVAVFAGWRKRQEARPS